MGPSSLVDDDVARSVGRAREGERGVRLREGLGAARGSDGWRERKKKLGEKICLGRKKQNEAVVISGMVSNFL